MVDRQHLFSVYVHLPPNKTLSGPPSIFHGREIPGSISTAWGEWSLANASRVLIRHALWLSWLLLCFVMPRTLTALILIFNVHWQEDSCSLFVCM